MCWDPRREDRIWRIAHTPKLVSSISMFILLMYNDGFQSMVTRPAASASSGNWIEIQIRLPPPRPTKSETLGVAFGSRGLSAWNVFDFLHFVSLDIENRVSLKAYSEPLH